VLVDPYLKLDALHTIVVSTQLTRLLVSGKRNNSTEVAAMQTYLDSPSLTRQVEVRQSTELHDRILITEDKSVLTLGTSLNGVGRTTTVLTPMPEQAGVVLREAYEQLWLDAELVGPEPVEDDEPDDAIEDEDNDASGADGDADERPTT
jgi:hypothetical protein